MKSLDIYGDQYSEIPKKIRVACRGVVTQENSILLSYEVNTDQWFIPGGGLENGESLEACCIRELAEETGYVVKPSDKYLVLNEHYGEWLFVSHYFICTIEGSTERKLTDLETEVGLQPRWISVEDAAKIYSKYPDYSGDNPMKCGAYYREHMALSAYLSLQNT